MQVEIPHPLAEQVALAARLQAKSASDFVLTAVRESLASKPVSSPSVRDRSGDDPLLGLLSEEPELADFIEQSAMQAREARPLRTSRG